MASGTCGTNATWNLNESTKVLTISGSGAMTNFSTASPSPWYDYRNDITSVIVQEGITTIGDYAFYYHSAIPSITIPNSVTTIGKYAFSSCSGATTVVIGSRVTDIQKNAFYASKSVKSINFLGNQPTLEENSFKLGISSTSSATATIQSSGWANATVFNSNVIGTYTTLKYKRIVEWLGVDLSANPVKTSQVFILSVDVKDFSWGRWSSEIWNSVKIYTWNEIKGE